MTLSTAGVSGLATAEVRSVREGRAPENFTFAEQELVLSGSEALLGSLTGGFRTTDKRGKVTRVDETDHGRTILEIGGRAVKDVYEEWSEGRIIKGVEFNDEGTHENGASVDFYRWTDAAKPSWYGGKGYPFQALEQGNTDFSCNTKLPEYGCAHVVR